MTATSRRVCPGAPTATGRPPCRQGRARQKVQEYLDAGTQLVWVVFPEQRRIRVHTAPDAVHWLGEDDTLSGEPILPGFSCSVREVLEL